MSTAVQKYVDLLDAFLCGKLSAQDFERRYLDAWSEDKLLWEAEDDGYATDSESRVLEQLFYDIDAYCGEERPLDERLDIGEEELRQRAKRAIRVLQG